MARSRLYRAMLSMGALWLAAAAPARRTAPGMLDDPAASADQVAIQLTGRLPSGWTVSPPQNVLGIPQVIIGIPSSWRGSPISAAMALCPDRDDALWQAPALAEGRMRMVVRYQGRDWPPYECSP